MAMAEQQLNGRRSFHDEVDSATLTTTNLDRCIQCGTCGGSCPSGPDMDHTPRRIFAMINAGLRDEVLTSNTPWYCVSCYYCMVRCPHDVHITDIMYTLKRMAIAEGKYKESDASDAPDFSDTFMGFVNSNGRSFELGVATRYHLRHHPLSAVKMASMGLGMLLKGRMDLRPNKIKNMDQLKAILAKARELEGEAS
jgi:heterodisulfide reductase subunit C